MISYAQNGEDAVLARLFDRSTGFYVDVGAGHPVTDSVSKHFSDRGWRGMNIEPLPEEHALLCAARPRDLNICAAVTNRTGRVTLYPGPASNRGASTVVPHLAPPAGGDELAPEPIEVDAVRLMDLLDDHQVPPIDFLKIDVEGAESMVIGEVDWDAVRPRVIVVEATLPNTTTPSHDEWEPVLLRAGYRCVLFDGLNRFYAQVDDAEACRLLAAPANVFDDIEPWRWVARVADAEARADAARTQIVTLSSGLDEALQYAATLEASRGTFERWTETVRSEVAELAATATALLHLADPNAADFGLG